MTHETPDESFHRATFTVERYGDRAFVQEFGFDTAGTRIEISLEEFERLKTGEASIWDVTRQTHGGMLRYYLFSNVYVLAILVTLMIGIVLAVLPF